MPQLEQELGISASAIRGMLARGELRGRKVGRQWRVRRAWLDAWFAEVEEAPADHVVRAVEDARRRRGAGGGKNSKKSCGSGGPDVAGCGEPPA